MAAKQRLDAIVGQIDTALSNLIAEAKAAGYTIPDENIERMKADEMLCPTDVQQQEQCEWCAGSGQYAHPDGPADYYLEPCLCQEELY